MPYFVPAPIPRVEEIPEEEKADLEVQAAIANLNEACDKRLEKMFPCCCLLSAVTTVCCLSLSASSCPFRLWCVVSECVTGGVARSQLSAAAKEMVFSPSLSPPPPPTP